MSELHPQCITDTAGKNLVILTQDEFDALIEEAKDLADIRLYDEVKKSDSDERIAVEDVFNMIEAKRINSK